MRKASQISVIITIIAFFIIAYLAFDVFTSGSMLDNNDTDGMLAVFMGVLAACISLIGVLFAVAARSSDDLFASSAFYFFSCMIDAFETHGYKELQLWGILFFLLSAVFLVSGLQRKKKEKLQGKGRKKSSRRKARV